MQPISTRRSTFGRKPEQQVAAPGPCARPRLALDATAPRPHNALATMPSFLKVWPIHLRREPVSPDGIFLPCLLAVGLATGGTASAQTWQREEVDFARIEEKAKAAAAEPYRAPDSGSMPQWMKDLSYDQYRDIRYREDSAIWKTEGLPFHMMLFHPGYLYREPVAVREITRTHSQIIRFNPDFFEYGHLVTNRGDTPSDIGYAGFKLLAPMNIPERFDEMVVFLGASYWRALGTAQHWGLSARGAAVDTGTQGPEEFPAFRQFWVRKPDQGAKSVEVFALLDSPSLAGAYAFTITPGTDTTVDVNAVLFPRKAMTRFGLAPMSSMFWFGENSRRRFDDFRPEVHDSDGLALLSSTGERIWRPLANDTNRVEFSFFQMEKPAGFGLVQRDRRFAAYEDGEAAYHERPTLWVEPTSDWGAGDVMLMEIPTANELADNIVALWQPATAPQPGQRIAFSYRQHWTKNDDPAQAGGRVVATRTGVHEWQKEQRTVAVEFTGGKLDALPADKPPEAVVSVLAGAEPPKVKVQGLAVQTLPEKRWRVSFQLAPTAEGGKLAEAGPVELRGCLKQGDDYLTETWAYRIIP